MSAAVSLLAGVTVLVGFWSHRPGPPRVFALLPVRPPRTARSSPMTRRLAGAAVAATAVWFAVAPLAPVAGVTAWAVPVWRQRRRRIDARAAVGRALPEVVDLFFVAVGAGLTVPLAVAAVGERVDGVFGDVLQRVTAAVTAGQRCGDALDDAAIELGADARPLLDALRTSERYGAPLGDALVRISADVRADRRRRAEEVARRVPVKLLFPLVLCVLPAFALLTVAPLLAGTFGSLRLS